MPTVKEVLIYTYAELTEPAKEKARDWFREGNLDYAWWDSVYDYAVEVAEAMGIEISRKDKNTPAIYFSGFCNQGDGACFEGSYAYKKGALAAVRKEYPAYRVVDGTRVDFARNVEIHRIARALQDVQRPNFYRLEATCTQRGRHNSLCVEVSDSESLYRDIGDAEDEVTQALNDFADWIYRALEDDCNWLNSDEVVEESIEANKYAFTEDGEIE